ncbi:pirin family protein [Egibacter rhizosphaerae]|nr:pirin family protein [Egibacter rhizosphaerae]
MTHTDTATPTALHLAPEDYHVIRAEDFNAPGLQAREAIGPFVRVQALGNLLTVHDSSFEAERGIGHHPHQRMERLFYIVDGTVDHDDVLNHITGHMGTGDLGILTEGMRGMIHSEWNNSPGPARAYIFVYPNQPLHDSASFGAIRDHEAPRVTERDGVVAKQVVRRGEERINGDFRRFDDVAVAAGAATEWELDEGEAGLLFVLDGSADVTVDGEPVAPAGFEHTVALPPGPEVRRVQATAREDSRLLRAITGPGFGLRLQE